MTYMANKIRAMFRNTDPSKTDQSQAKDTDVNHIIKRFQQTQSAPPMKTPGSYADITEVPGDLRAALEMATSMQSLRQRLPEPLRAYPVEDLLVMTPAELNSIVNPKPATKPAEENKT